MESICATQIDRIAVDRANEGDKLRIKAAIGEPEQNSTDDRDPDSERQKRMNLVFLEIIENRPESQLEMIDSHRGDVDCNQRILI